jgi:hypothetical protein
MQAEIGRDEPWFVLMVGDFTYADDHGPAAMERDFNDVMAWSLDKTRSWLERPSALRRPCDSSALRRTQRDHTRHTAAPSFGADGNGPAGGRRAVVRRRM